MNFNLYLSFNGQCAAAFKFYEKHLGDKITFTMTYADSPMAAQFPREWSDKIMHTTLTLGDQVPQGADAAPGVFQKPQGFSIALGLKDPSEAERVFNALAENGKVETPLQETFWALRYGALVDQFGTPWAINCERPA